MAIIIGLQHPHKSMQEVAQLLRSLLDWLLAVFIPDALVFLGRAAGKACTARVDTARAANGQAGAAQPSSAANPAATKAGVQPTHEPTSMCSTHHAEAAAGFATAFAVHGYGYSSTEFLPSRQAQFPQLSNITYLDHAAATLCSKQQLEETQAEQLQQLLANPHSQLPVGLDHSAVAIEELRLMTLHLLNAPAVEYEVRCYQQALACVRLTARAALPVGLQGLKQRPMHGIVASTTDWCCCRSGVILQQQGLCAVTVSMHACMHTSTAPTCCPAFVTVLLRSCSPLEQQLL